MTTYNTSDFRKGLKVQIDGVPYLMVEMNFRKPGKGNALYECKMKNLVRGTMVDRTYRAGQTLEAADVVEFAAQFLYRQQDKFVFMNNETYEQYELTKEQVGDAWKFLKDGMECSLMVYNNNPLTVTPPNHVVLRSSTPSRPPAATRPPTCRSRSSWKRAPRSEPRPSSTRATIFASTPAPASTSNGPKRRKNEP